MASIMLSMLFMHLAAFFLQVFLPFLVIIFVLATAAAVPTASPMPIPLTMDMFDDENKFIPPIKNIH